MKHKIPEVFLCYLWKFQLIKLPLYTTDKKQIMVKFQGIRNMDGGPDFSNAIVQIEKTVWAGQIEVHYKSSDWYQHKHHLNKKYEGVILHVVYDHDMEVRHSDQSVIPTLSLHDRFTKKIFQQFEQLIQNQSWIPCEKQIHAIDEFKKLHFLSRLAVERLERKTSLMKVRLLKNKNDFEQLFYIQLAKYFGSKTNGIPFEMLADSLPYHIIQKHKDSLMQIETLLFGQAGMLDHEFTDPYPKSLKKEYAHLKNKYSLNPMAGHLWKYLRLRPVNFPDIRIAQFAQLLCQSESLFSKVIEFEELNEIAKLFNLQASEYWDTHYHFDKKTNEKIKTLGQSTINLILINGLVPILFVYGKHIGDHGLTQRALLFLNQIKAESNATIRQFKKLGFNTGSAFFTQALMELKTQYCDFKKCLDCEFGVELLRQKN